VTFQATSTRKCKIVTEARGTCTDCIYGLGSEGFGDPCDSDRGIPSDPR
jgi:hypothetical protein